MVLFINAVDELLSEKGLGFVTNIINIAFIALLAILITKGVRRLMQRLRSSRRISDDPVKQKRAETAETLMASILNYVTSFIAAALIASALGFGASVRSLLAAAGIGGIVIGIGAQSLISDIVNGFFFLFEDQFSVGDMIDAGGITGTVESIGLRTTTVRAFTGEVSVIPNGSIRTLTNYSRTNSLAIVDIPVALSADADAAMALMRQEDGIAPALMRSLGVSVAVFNAPLEQSIGTYPKVSGCSGELYLSESLRKALEKAEKEASLMGDEYVSVEHLILGIIEEPPTRSRSSSRIWALRNRNFWRRSRMCGAIGG